MAIQPTQLPPPSDLTLDQNWVALEPGVYPPRTDLTPFKGTNLTNSEMLDYRPDSPFGVGDSQSVVYIYPQGTIEIIGQVYCWNRLVKPGIYSQFEKIRFISGEEVLPRYDGVYSHHTAYNQTLRIPSQSKYVKRNTQGNQTLIQYNYVSFDEAILQRNGDKIYPIPILNGKLTIYPDGTFKTEGIVVQSTTGKAVHPYGYIGDISYSGYAYVETFINEYTKDDINPKNVYKLVSENEDGSVTYEAIEVNKTVKADRPPMLPLGLIPVNDGQVTVGLDGWVSLKGTVINSQGYLINVDKLYYPEFCFLENGRLRYNDKFLDKTKLYNPIVNAPYGGNLDEFKRTVLKVADGAIDIYRYHPDNESYTCYTDQLEIATYTRMKGWDNFTTESPSTITLKSLLEFWETTPLFNLVQTSIPINELYYPWTSYRSLKVGAHYRNPTLRINPQGHFETYLTIDHTMFWYPDDLYPRVMKTYINDLLYREGRIADTLLNHEEEDTFIPAIQLNQRGEKITNTFYPFLTKRQYDKLSENGKDPNDKANGYTEADSWFKLFRNPDDNNNVYIQINQNVIWKRNDEFYTLEEGIVKFDINWPDIQEGTHRVFDVNGYFTDEPIFIKADGITPGAIGNDLINIDGIKRQEEGLFKLVKRNVTHYLSDREKYYITNTVYNSKPYLDKETFKLEANRGYVIDKVYGDDLTLGFLDYYTFRYNDVVPPILNVIGFFPNSSKSLTTRNYTYPSPDSRIYRFNKRQNRFMLYENGLMYFADTRFRALFTKSNIGLDTIGLPQISYAQPVPSLGSKRTLSDHLGTTTPYQPLASIPLYRNGEIGREQRPVFTLPTKWLATDGELPVRVRFADETTFFYRLAHDTGYITGGFIANSNTTINIPVNTITRIGYVEVWYDDPYDEDYEYNVLRTRIRRDNTLLPLEIITPYGDIYTSVSIIRGKAEPHATVTLIDTGSNNSIIKTTTADKYGNWVFEELQLQADKTYRIKQRDNEFNLEAHLDFSVIRDSLKYGDILTPEEMFGVDIYLIPFNYKNSRPELSDVPYQIQSSITWDIDKGTYTINGFVGDNETRDTMYHEGTYPIGTLPPQYTNILPYGNEYLHNGEHYTMWRTRRNEIISGLDRNGNPGYVISKTGYQAKVTALKEETAWSIRKYDLRDVHHFLISPSWKARTIEYVNDTTKVTDDFLRELNITREMLALFVSNPIPYLIRDVMFNIEYRDANGRIDHGTFIRFSNLHVSRKDDNLIFEYDIPEFNLPMDPHPLYLINPNVDGKRLPEGGIYTPELFIQRLSRTKPWFMNYFSNEGIPMVDIIKQSGDALITNYHSVVSVPNTTNGVPIFVKFDKTKRGPWVYNNNVERTLITPANPNDRNQSVSIYEIENWDELPIEENLTNVTDRNQLVYLSADYYYHLTQCYHQIHWSERMTDTQLAHWTNKGFNPTIFDYSGGSTAQIIYNRDGKTVLIIGVIKINGRVTSDITQLVAHPNEIVYQPPE